jgi:hypothetical protein
MNITCTEHIAFSFADSKVCSLVAESRVLSGFLEIITLKVSPSAIVYILRY